MSIICRPVLVCALLLLSIGCGSGNSGNGRLPTGIRKELQEGMRDVLQLAQLSTAFAEAEEAATGDPSVIGRLGRPIEHVSQPTRQGTGNLNFDGELFEFVIKGPNGSATVRAVAMPFSKTQNSVFVARKITVTFSDGSTVDVPVEHEQEKQP